MESPAETDTEHIQANVRMARRKKKACEDQVNVFESEKKKKKKKKKNQAGLRLLFPLTKSQKRIEKYLDL